MISVGNEPAPVVNCIALQRSDSFLSIKASAAGRSKSQPGYRMQQARQEGGAQAPEPREVLKTALSGIAMRQVLLRGSASCLPWENGMSGDKTGTGAHTMECRRWHGILVQCRLLQAHWGLQSNRERIWKIPHLMIFTFTSPNSRKLFTPH